MKNIFIEGTQGAGKTTLLKSLSEKLEGYHMYLEGDISPIELAWCSYMTMKEYQQTLARFPNLVSEIEAHTVKEEKHFIIEYTRIMTDTKDFYPYMEQYEIYNGRLVFDDFKELIFSRLKSFNGIQNLFECSLFQNIIEELILYYCKTEEEIISFYRELFEIIKHKNFLLLYIYSDDIESNILKIKKERSDENGVELWYPLMMQYLNDSPYGKKSKFIDISDMVAHFKMRMNLELRIIKEIMGDYSMILPAKSYNIEDIIDRIEG